MRIAILGNSGSGKSTLARWLATRTGAPPLDLDTVAWKPGEVAVPRDPEEAAADVRAFCAAPAWIVEGCYADLVGHALDFAPRLVFLNPGVEQCLANCRARPWESHKFSSKEEQDRHLDFLLQWVRDYVDRDGSMSLQAHRHCFDGYDGPKSELVRQPTLDPPSAELLEWLAER